MKSLALTGLDAQNPLGFMASLGLLKVLSETAKKARMSPPALSFDEATYQPSIAIEQGMESVVEAVLLDAREQLASRSMRFSYDESGDAVDAAFPATGVTRDLKPSLRAARSLMTLVAHEGRRDADQVAGFFSDIVQQAMGDVGGQKPAKPTAFHFTSGQQTFLKMACELAAGMAKEDVLEALVGPWRGESSLPSFAWDSSSTRMYALRADNPSTNARGSIAAANWLAFQSLSFFPVKVRRGQLVTTAITGGWKDSIFTWPIWTVPLSARVVASLLQIEMRYLRQGEREAMGLATVFQSRIQRPDKYGSFSPAGVLVPAK